MAILSEDVIIRLLVDTQKGVADLKKGEAATESFAKKALKMATAMGGVALAFELATKAVTALIQYVKEAEKAYVDLVKSSENYVEGVYSEVDAIDALEAAKLRAQEVNGKIIAQALEGVRVRRAENIETRAAFRETATLTQALIAGYAASFGLVGITRKYRQSVIDAAAATREFTTATEDQSAASNLQASYSAAMTEYVAQYIIQNRDITDILKGVTNQFGLLTDAEKIHYDTAQQILTLDAVMAEQTEKNTNLLAESGFTYAETTEKIYAARDAKLAMLTVDKEEIDVLQKLRDGWMEWSNAQQLAAQQSLALAAQQQAEMISGLNAVGGAVNQFLSDVFGETKGAAIAQALINTALAITNVLANIPAPFNFAAAALVGAAGAAQVANISNQSFATGTPPGGYRIPEGYSDDSYPVRAASGETVTVTRPGQEQGQMLNASINIDGYEFGRVITRLFEDRKAVISGVTA